MKSFLYCSAGTRAIKLSSTTSEVRFGLQAYIAASSNIH